MNQALFESEVARLKLPRIPGRIAPIPPPEAPAEATSVLASTTRRRLWLSRLLGAGLTPVPEPERAPRRDPLLTLVHRITNGFTLAEYERAQALGFEAYVEEQLDHLSIPDTEMDALIAQHFAEIDDSPKQIFDTHSAVPFAHMVLLKGARLARAVGSKRQLFERMCEFWGDHFNIDHNKGLGFALLPEHDRTVIRAHALGSFPELLEATAFSGAMLYYLDNWLNVRGVPQENYAREIMELHTLSLTGGYNEADVVEVAKCFTGWTLVGDPDSPDWLRGTYDPSQHTLGKKFLLGHVVPETPHVRRSDGGSLRTDAHAVLDILVRHPSTPQFLARKLIRFFLTPQPPVSLVDQVAEAYTSSGGDIKAMLRVILTRRNFALNSAALDPLYRRPFTFVTALFRSLDGFVRRGNQAVSHLATMGHSPFDWVAPTGYPEGFDHWGNQLLPRWTFSATLFRPNFLYNGVRLIEPEDLMARLGIQTPADRPGLARRINERFLGELLTPFEVAVLQDFIDAYPTTFDDVALYDVLALATELPGTQWN